METIYTKRVNQLIKNAGMQNLLTAKVVGIAGDGLYHKDFTSAVFNYKNDDAGVKQAEAFIAGFALRANHPSNA